MKSEHTSCEKIKQSVRENQKNELNIGKECTADIENRKIRSTKTIRVHRRTAIENDSFCSRRVARSLLVGYTRELSGSRRGRLHYTWRRRLRYRTGNSSNEYNPPSSAQSSRAHTSVFNFQFPTTLIVTSGSTEEALETWIDSSGYCQQVSSVRSTLRERERKKTGTAQFVRDQWLKRHYWYVPEVKTNNRYLHWRDKLVKCPFFSIFKFSFQI